MSLTCRALWAECQDSSIQVFEREHFLRFVILLKLREKRKKKKKARTKTKQNKTKQTNKPWIQYQNRTQGHGGKGPVFRAGE